jgi:predicted nuclease of restriction endonuclease-like (RecB) superfamily
MNFEKLVLRIQQTSEFLQQNAVKAVNMHLTFRNWLTGFYIVEFEQNGSDRAEYGAKLLENIAKSISVKGLTAPELSRCRQFYSAYPQILGLMPQEFKNVLPADFFPENAENSILGLPPQELQNEDIKHVSTIFQSISYTHFTELIKIDDSTKRRFYELLVLKTQPSVKELKRQIETLTFERVGLSENHKNSFDEVVNRIQPQQATDLIKSHYFFEFLNVGQPHLIEETELEQALVSHLQQFITELGKVRSVYEQRTEKYEIKTSS